MISLRWHKDAELEAFAAAAYYDERRRNGGAEFVGELWDAVQLVREFPYAGTPVGYGVRRVVLQRYRYNLLYVPETEAIFVVAVAHQRLSPEYWRYRLDS